MHYYFWYRLPFSIPIPTPITVVAYFVAVAISFCVFKLWLQRHILHIFDPFMALQVYAEHTWFDARVSILLQRL